MGVLIEAIASSSSSVLNPIEFCKEPDDLFIRVCALLNDLYVAYCYILYLKYFVFCMRLDPFVVN